MKIRILSALAALVLAVTGAVMILGYVNGADKRALAGTETRSVLVVTQAIAAGTPATEIAAFVAVRSLPRSVIPLGVVEQLSALSGTVAAVDLVPGEQLLRSRFVKPSSLQAPGTVASPKGMQELTVQLGPDRVVGGRLKAGDRVGVYLSYPATGTSSARTALAYERVLVTNVQGSPAVPSASDPAAPPAAAPTGALLVTLAVSSAEASRIVFTAEFGTLWLSLAPTEPGSASGGAVTDDTPLP